MPPPPPAGTSPSNRFIFKKPTNKPTSGARQDHANKGGEYDDSASGGVQHDVGQFASIPRFTAPGSRSTYATPHPANNSASPTKSSFAVLGAAPPQQRDDVHDVDATPDSDDEDMLDNEISPVYVSQLPATRIDPEPARLNLPPSPKRAKLGEGLKSHFSSKAHVPYFMPPPASSLQPHTASSQTLGANRFFIPPLASQIPSTAGTTVDPSANRPAFLKPSIPPPGQSSDLEPLPDAFSPHRKGQRYVPGGMTAELSAWVIETGQNAALSRRGKAGLLRGQDFVREVKVEKVQEGDGGDAGPVFVEGTDEHGGPVKVVLAHSGEKRELVRAGDVVGIRAPSWGVQVGKSDGDWVVGVDWRIIRG